MEIRSVRDKVFVPVYVSISYVFADSTAIKPTHMMEPKMAAITTNATLENQLPFGTSSDSESPTEPVSQQTIAMLRAKVVPNKI